MSQTASVRVEGMSCAACVGRVERALTALPGVEEAAVSLISGDARIRFAVSPDLGAVATALKSAGYAMAETEAVLVVEGMTCASCVGRVERALTSQPGVIAASASFATGEARVRYAAGAVGPSELAAAVTAAGYAARPRADQAASPASRQVAEAQVMHRRFLWSLVLTLPVLFLSMGAHAVPALHHWLAATVGTAATNIAQAVLTLALLAGPGRVFLARGLPALLRGAPEMNSLVALGALSAVGYSLVATFAPGLLPEAARGVYYEAAASIVTLILLGRMLETRAKGRASEAIARLTDLRPATALVLREGGREAEIPALELVPGDVVRLRPGERVAADGQVTEGTSHVDESMLTGEPLPVVKADGNSLAGGTVNGTGTLTYRVTATGAETVLARIIRMVEDAQATKLPVQAMVDRITLWFVPAVITLAVLTVAVWLSVGPEPRLTHALVAGISVLIIACPCAMGLATPVSVLVGSGRGAELGILFRKGDALQSLAGVRTVAFDKTGTLTEGHPSLAAIHPVGAWTADELLRLAASAETGSEHPLARALVTAAADRGIGLAQTEGGRALAGQGYAAKVAGHAILLGNRAALERDGISAGNLADTAAEGAGQGLTPIFLAIDGQLAGLFVVADRVRPTSAAAIGALRQKGLATAMISGDAEATARTVARGLGIETVIAGVLPDGKVEALARLPGRPVAFVGDGLNDGPALAAADVGIAMGGGTDLAREAADVVIMRNDLALVASAIALSRATLSNIRQNLFWAFGYNVVLIPVAAGALYPVNGLMLSPLLASAAMALSSVFVVTNALRLRRFSRPGG